MNDEEKKLTPEQEMQRIYAQRRTTSLMEQIANQSQRIADLEANLAVLQHQIELLDKAAKSQSNLSLKEEESMPGDKPLESDLEKADQKH